MAKLSKMQQYAVLYLNEFKKMDSISISKELKLSVASIDKLINGKTTTQTKTDKTKDLRIRQTSVKKNNSVSIMTQAASQVGDEFLQSMDHKTKNTDSYIFRPNR
jgi:hypothetical protein